VQGEGWEGEKIAAEPPNSPPVSELLERGGRSTKKKGKLNEHTVIDHREKRKLVKTV